MEFRFLGTKYYQILMYNNITIKFYLIYYIVYIVDYSVYISTILRMTLSQ